MSIGAAADLEPGQQGDHGHDGDGEHRPRQRREPVAADDPAAVRGGQHQPAREAGLEVARDGEAREDAAERRRLQQHEAVDEGRVAAVEVEARDRVDAREAARERREEEHREQQRRDDDRRVREEVVGAAPADGARDRPEAAAAHVRTILVRSAEAAATSAISAMPPAHAKPSASASPSQPSIISERMHSSM